MHAITFDFGQTLAELDTDLLAARCNERGLLLPADSLEPHVEAAWHAYGEAKRSGAEGRTAWCAFMSELLGLAAARRDSSDKGDGGAPLSEVVAWLWDEQPKRNLWRKPVAGMFELVEELVSKGERVGILSNSEGRLAELVEAMGKRHLFLAIVDSGTLGIEKPNPAIFEHAAQRLGVPVDAITHVGDAWEADVRGALAAGCSAIYFSRLPMPTAEPRVVRAFGAEEVRQALRDTLRDRTNASLKAMDRN
jgi:putative hydrolase of the HAD superfamily